MTAHELELEKKLKELTEQNKELERVLSVMDSISVENVVLHETIREYGDVIQHLKETITKLL